MPRVKFFVGLGILCLLLFRPQSTLAQISNDIPVTVGVPATALAISGCASPSAFVQIFDNNTPVGAVVANQAGRFNKTLTYTLEGTGLHTVKLFFDDANRRTSSIVNTTVSVSVQATTPLNLLLATTVEHEPEPVSVGNFLIFRGTTCPKALVNLRLDNNQTLTAQADASGNWFIIADSENYYVGAHVYKVISRLGNQVSQPSHIYQFTTIGANPPRPSQPDLSPPSIIEPNDLFLSSTPIVTLRGTGPPNAQIELFIDSISSGSFFVGADGQWSFTVNMNSALHTITARTCFGGRCGQFSNPVRIRLAGDPNSCRSPLRLQSYRYYNVHRNDGIDLGLIDPPTAEASINWGDTVVENVSLVSADELRLHHVYKDTGLYSGSLSLIQNGCAFTRHFSVHVTPVEATWHWWWPVGILILLVVMLLRRRRRDQAKHQVPHFSAAPSDSGTSHTPWHDS